MSNVNLEKNYTPEAEKKKRQFQNVIYFAITIFILSSYILGYWNYAKTEDVKLFELIDYIVTRFNYEGFWGLFYPPIYYAKSLPIAILVSFLIAFAKNTDNELNYTYNKEESAGSARFMTKEEIKEYNKLYIKPTPLPLPANAPGINDLNNYSDSIILSKNFSRPLNSREFNSNSNVLICGGSGSGKSRGYVRPALLNMYGSYVVTDPSGELVTSVGKCMKEHGYKIKIFNVNEMQYSNCYNPLMYIKKDQDVDTVVNVLINNTSGKIPQNADADFFVKAEKLLYTACIFYLKDYGNDVSNMTFSGILDMINSSSVDEQTGGSSSLIDKIFASLPNDAVAKKTYNSFKQAAGRTLKSIIISCVTRLRPFVIPQIAALTSKDEMEFDKLPFERTVLFVITPTNNQTYNFLVAMLFAQVYQTLYFLGDEQASRGEGPSLPIPVRCIHDEYATSGSVPNMNNTLATCRKYNIQASVILQHMSQLELLHDKEAKTFDENCATTLFLGGKEHNGLKVISDMLGNTTIKVLNNSFSTTGKSSANKSEQYKEKPLMSPSDLFTMSKNDCIVMSSGFNPVRDKKYDLKKHPYYSQTLEASKKNAFAFKLLPSYNNMIIKSTGYLTAAREAKRYKDGVEAKKIKNINENIKKGKQGQSNISVLNSVTLDPLTELNKMIAINNDLTKATNEGISSKIIAVKTDPVQARLLFKALGNYHKTHKGKPCIIISDTSDKTDPYCYACMTITDNNIKKLIDNEPAGENAEFLEIKNYEENLAQFVISINVFESFVDKLNKAYEFE